jgi:hypothetical protein
LGILGKIAVFIGFIHSYLAGKAHLLVALCGTVDLVFTILFIGFLIRAQKIKEF